MGSGPSCHKPRKTMSVRSGDLVSKRMFSEGLLSNIVFFPPQLTKSPGQLNLSGLQHRIFLAKESTDVQIQER